MCHMQDMPEVPTCDGSVVSGRRSMRRASSRTEEKKWIQKMWNSCHTTCGPGECCEHDRPRLNSVWDDRRDTNNRSIRFCVDSGASRTVVPVDHPAARGYKTHYDLLTGSTYVTAGKRWIWDEGKRILCAKGPKGPLVLNTRKCACRQPLMSVIEMIDHNQWIVF